MIFQLDEDKVLLCDPKDDMAATPLFLPKRKMSAMGAEGMKKREIKEWLREHFPNIPILRKAITKQKVRKFREPILSGEQVRRGECDPEEKARIVRQCLEKYPIFAAYTKSSMRDLFARAPEYKDREDKEQLRTDILFCRYAYGFEPEEYLCFGLENKTEAQKREFVSDIDRHCYAYRMNDPFEIPVFNNKAKTYRMFRPYFHRNAVAIHKPKDLSKFQAYVREHPVFVKKAVYESMGRSVELVDVENCGRTKEQVFHELIGKGMHILEERVEQCGVMSALNASSVNTVRCITLNTKNGVQIPYCFMKVGRAGSFVDNGGAGGILVGIDRDTGVLNTDGYDERNIRYASHPDSGITFKGYQLPQWDSMLAVCKEMSAKINKVKYIGWDMAHTDQGWVVIEGNGMSQMIGPQIVWQYGIKAELEAYISSMELMC